MTFCQKGVTAGVSDFSHSTAVHQPGQLQSYHGISAVCPSHALRLASCYLESCIELVQHGVQQQGATCCTS